MSGVVKVYEQGGPEVLKYEQRDIGKPDSDEVLIRQTAIGINYLDTYFRKGDFSPSQLPFVNGFEAAGVIEEVGRSVTDFKKGDRIAYQLAMGAYAEHRILGTNRLVKIPEFISDEAAASIMLKGMTAEYLLHREYKVGPDDTILIHAASGGVGSLMVPWAKALGATVIGTVSTQKKADRIKELGADHAILYQDVDFVEAVNEITDGSGVSVIFDGVGKTTFEKGFDCLAIFGVNIMFGWASGKVEPYDPHKLNGKSHRISNPSVGHYTGTREMLDLSASRLFKAIEDGVIKNFEPNHRYKLAETNEAHADLEDRKTSGSIVLIP